MSLYRICRPVLFTLPPELAHRLTVKSLSLAGRLLPTAGPDDYRLAVKAMGLDFANPFGMAAGFDKDGEAIDGLLKIGFGFTEAGTVTPLPQDGNPAPRVFRLLREEALINRLGFNNQGHAALRERLTGGADAQESGQQNSRARGIVGVNIGANKESEDRIADYRLGAAHFASLADYLTVNVSSPNTPGLRDLQSGEALGEILKQVKKAAPKTPVLVKIAPDLTEPQIEEIADIVMQAKPAGMIISNTTLDRDGVPATPHRHEAGGLSGPPLFDKSTELLRRMHMLTKGKMTLIGAGGVSSAADALVKIRAGASLVQLYTALVYQGPGLVKKMKRELVTLLDDEGFKTVADAVGADHKSRKK